MAISKPQQAHVSIEENRALKEEALLGIYSWTDMGR